MQSVCKCNAGNNRMKVQRKN